MEPVSESFFSEYFILVCANVRKLRKKIIVDDKILNREIQNNILKNFIRYILSLFKINIRYQLVPGISFFGFNFFLESIRIYLFKFGVSFLGKNLDAY